VSDAAVASDTVKITVHVNRPLSIRWKADGGQWINLNIH
jgi:hypothetical protein